jgi:hypothetical protein
MRHFIQQLRRMPGWLLGVVLAELIWTAAWLGMYFFEFIERFLPQSLDWFDIPDTLGSICAFIAAPVAVGGWLMVWGDNGPPYPWLESWQFQVIFAVMFYGLLGAVLGCTVTFLRRHAMPSEFDATRNEN